MLAGYISFIALLFSLYVVVGGIVVSGNFHGTPGGNTGMLLLGTMLASFVGTTGAGTLTSTLPWAGTFHAIGARLLRDYAAQISVDPAFTIHAART
jgi:hypothetical protein